MSLNLNLLNPKCAAMTAMAVSLYFVFPTRDDPNVLRNVAALSMTAMAVSLHFVFPTRDDPNVLRNVAALSVGTYVGLAWYDALYDCEDKSKASEWFTLYRPLKPGVVDGEYRIS